MLGCSEIRSASKFSCAILADFVTLGFCMSLFTLSRVVLRESLFVRLCLMGHSDVDTREKQSCLAQFGKSAGICTTVGRAYDPEVCVYVRTFATNILEKTTTTPRASRNRDRVGHPFYFGQITDSVGAADIRRCSRALSGGLAFASRMVAGAIDVRSPFHSLALNAAVPS